MEFVLRSIINDENEIEYSIRLQNGKKRIVFTNQICEMLNIKITDWNKILIKQGAVIEHNTDIDGLTYHRIIFKSLELTNQAINYLNTIYAPILAILYNTIEID